MTPQQLHVFAATIGGEARGEPFEGQAGVAHVILRRARLPGWPDDIHAVCLEEKQFSCWNPGDANYLWVHTVGTEDPGYLSALYVGTGALLGQIENPMEGATHYHSVSMHPGWADEMTFLGQIGGHFYYREDR